MKNRGCILVLAFVLGAALLAVASAFTGRLYSGNPYAGTSKAGEEKEASKETSPDAHDGEAIEIILGGEEDPSQTDADTSDADAGNGAVVRLCFAGDVLLSDYVLSAYDQAGGVSGILDGSLRTVIAASDLFIVNEEFPFSERGTQAADKQYTFRLNPQRVSIFNELGIGLVTLANNHALDFGTEALLDTLDVLDGAGIAHIGAGKNIKEAKEAVCFELGDYTIGFLGASRVIPVASWTAGENAPGMLTTYDPAILVGEIAALKETCDLVVVYVHWGIERNEYPESYQRELARRYIDAGADLVVGAHPHVLQGFEFYNGKPIIYSLGNFLFGSSIPKTVLLTVQWDGKDLRLFLTGASSASGYTYALEKEDAQNLYSYLTSISYSACVNDGGEILNAAD